MSLEKQIISGLLENDNQPMAAGAMQDLVGAERTTLFRRLSALADAGVILTEGVGRHRKYYLNVDSDAFVEWDLKQPPDRRSMVQYNPRVLDEYRPNVTAFLAPDQRKQMLAASAYGGGPVDDDGYRRILDSLIIDLSFASSNLENVQISWLDTKTLLEYGEKPEGLSDFQLRIVLNHKEAIRYMIQNKLAFVRRDIFDLHSLLISGLMNEPGTEGRIRTKVVGFTDSRYFPLSNPHQLSEEFEKFLQKASEIEDPFERAIFAMAFISYLQPFQDGNKRTARLATNLPLIDARLAPFSFADIKKSDYMFGLLAFYERGRTSFLAGAFFNSYLKTAQRYGELMKIAQDGGILNTVTLSEEPEPIPAVRKPRP